MIIDKILEIIMEIYLQTIFFNSNQEVAQIIFH